MNLKESKQSNCLVGLYIDELNPEISLATCLYSISEQVKPVDLLIYTHSLNENQINTIKKIADKPFYTLKSRNEKGEIVEQIIESKKALNYKIVNSEKPLNFSKFFNCIFIEAMKNEYDFISFVECDDSFSLKWFDIAEKFSKENENFDILLPLIKNSISGTFTGLLNEAPWAEGMAEEAGKTDVGLLMRFNCINPLGALYRVDRIKEYSEHEKDKEENPIIDSYKPMKESMKLSHYYEFFLRMIYNDLKVYTVPRLGYELNVVRKEKYTDATCKIPQDIASYPADRGGITQDEGRFWFELSKKEYFFDSDRSKIYELA